MPPDLSSLYAQPVVVFTSDLDWAPEWAIDAMASLFDARGVSWTPFITHRSACIEERFKDTRQAVGLHPNFLPGSTHGDDPEQVIDHVQALWPEAVSFRSHSFFDNSRVTALLNARGFRYDSNLCLFLQPDCVPLHHSSGLLRFPVFWEDDVHMTRELPFDLESIRPALETPGLKVINVHPIHVALNIPGLAEYRARKHLDLSTTWRESVCGGRGTRTLLEELLDWASQHRTRSLAEAWSDTQAART